jgi:HlyD family secretion protein
MKRFYILPGLAILGLILVIRTVVLASVPKPVQHPVVDPPKAPFETFVAGSGIIEASSENIAVASPISGIVGALHVKVGEPVEKHAPLFSLDDRETVAEIGVREAQVSSARALLEDAQTQLSIYRGVDDSRAVNRGELLKRQSTVSIADARLKEAQAQLAASQTTRDRMTIRAPVNGRVLQIKVRVGEFAPAQALATPLMIIGAVEPLAVRVDVDENDAWRVRNTASAVATLRGNPGISFPLSFLRFEPYVVPKRSLTGDSTERVDTRVLQIIYSFSPKEKPVFVGQLVDVFIEDLMTAEAR